MAVHTPRLDYPAFRKAAPDAHDALIALGQSAEAQGLEATLIELVKLRVSQMNACAFCTALHLDKARRLGVEPAKLDLVVAWRDAAIFDARERAALGFAERLTRLPETGIPDADWSAVLAVFSRPEALALAIAIANINAWNRLGVGLRFAPLGRARSQPQPGGKETVHTGG